MKRLALLLLPLALWSQSVTQISNTLIVATVGTEECDFTGVVSPLSAHATCKNNGVTFLDQDASFAASSSAVYNANANSLIGTIQWDFTQIPTGGLNAQVSANVPNGTPTLLTVPFLLPVAPPVITSALTASGTVNVPFNYQITATNNPTSFSAANLPTGLLLDAASGLISGTPTVAGVSNVALSATNASGSGPPVVLALTIAAPPPPPGTITRIQTMSGGGDYSNLITLTPKAPTVTGHGIVVFVSDYYGITEGTWTVSDGVNACNSAGHLQTAERIQVFYCPNITGTGNPIKVSSTVQTYWVATMVEYSGLGAVDGTPAQNFDGNYETPYASGPLSTTQASELLIGVVHYNNPNTASAVPDPGWTKVDAATDNSYMSQVVVEQIVNAAGPYNATGHLATAIPHSTMLLAIKGQ